jgi:hypothetical protein
MRAGSVQQGGAGDARGGLWHVGTHLLLRRRPVGQPALRARPRRCAARGRSEVSALTEDWSCWLTARACDTERVLCKGRCSREGAYLEQAADAGLRLGAAADAHLHVRAALGLADEELAVRPLVACNQGDALMRCPACDLAPADRQDGVAFMDDASCCRRSPRDDLDDGEL